ALTEFQEKIGKTDIIDLLRANGALNRGVRPGTMEEAIRLLGIGRGVRFSTCEFCSDLAVGEIRRGDGRSWKLCALCMRQARAIQEEREKHAEALRGVLRSCHAELAEALTLDPGCKHARANVRIAGRLLGQLGEPVTRRGNRRLG
ncbi:MAG: hypothetical protein AAB654_17090, partial [Acidobacteriota bacterium]